MKAVYTEMMMGQDTREDVDIRAYEFQESERH